MSVPSAVSDLVAWARSLPPTHDRTAPAYFAAMGVLAKHGHGQGPTDMNWQNQVAVACTSVAHRLREASGADLGHLACLAQGMVFFLRANGAVPPEALLKAFAAAHFNASSTVVVERWMEAYGFTADDPDMVASVAVPLPSGLAALAAERQHQAAPVLSFPLRPALGGEGRHGEITESVFAHAAASDGDAPESLRQQVFANPQAHESVPGLIVGRNLLPDWTLIVDVRVEPNPMSIHLQGLPLTYDSLFDGWIVDLRSLPQTERLRLLNAPLTVRLATGARIHITCRSQGS